MTPEQLNELAALKVALKQHIEEAEKATPGPWMNDPLKLGLVGDISQSNGDAIAQTQARQPLAAGKPDAERMANAAFIASARIMSPLACRIALAGIEALEGDYKDIVYHTAKAANERLLSILTIWKGGES